MDEPADQIAPLESEELYKIRDRHRIEKKQLQDEITKMRHSVKRNEKKKRREILAKAAEMQTALKEKHDAELSVFMKALNVSSEEKKTVNGDKEAVHELRKGHQPNKRRPRTRNRQLKLEQAESTSADVVNDTADVKWQRDAEEEMNFITEILNQRGLKRVLIPSDGDCMFASIADQLKRRSMNYTIGQLRKLATSTIRMNESHFSPFIIFEDNTNSLDGYLKQMEKPGIWGGYAELSALSKGLQIPIEVIQSMPKQMLFGEEYMHLAEPLVIIYFRHVCRLGEHYDSTIPTDLNASSEHEDEWIGLE